MWIFSRNPQIYLLWEVESKARMTGPPTRILRAVFTKSDLAMEKKVSCEIEAKASHKSSIFFMEMASTDTMFIIDK